MCRRGDIEKDGTGDGCWRGKVAYWKGSEGGGQYRKGDNKRADLLGLMDGEGQCGRCVVSGSGGREEEW